MSGSRHYLLVTRDGRAAAELRAGLGAGAQGPMLVQRDSLTEASSDLQGSVFDAVLVDVAFAGSDAPGELRWFAEATLETPLVILADGKDMFATLEAVRQGAEDYLLKSTFTDGSLAQRLEFMIDRFAAQRTTRRHLSESQRQAARFESLIRDNADAILVLRTDGQVVFANPAAGKLFKNNPIKLIGTSLGIPFETTGSKEIVIGHHQGNDTVADVRIMETTWDDRPAFLATLRDISWRKRTERNLVLAKQQAELASEMKSKFLAHMSHELRTPLNSILGFTEMMERGIFGAIGNERYVDYLATIRHSGTHLLTLINNLLDLSKIEAGREELNEEEVDITALLKAVAHAEEPNAKDRGLTLVCTVDDGPEYLMVDRVKIDQIVLNLLSNAIKFTPEGGKVSLLGRQTDSGDYEIRVADTGCGMDESEIPRAMSAFAQIRSPYRRAGDRGTGLGLPIARSLVEMHGGRLEITSRRGLGTEVRVQLPADRIAGTGAEHLSAAS